MAASPGGEFADSPPFDAATSFPIPLLMAAAFDDDLTEKVAHIIGTEARAWGNSGYAGVDYWTPNINPYKDPRWGRGSETPGEDALRVSRWARHIIHGLEGGDKNHRRIVATCKHYAGNDFERWHNVTRHDFDAQIGAQDLAEYYLKPFQACARDAQAGSVMCAYNAVNGKPACANDYLMETVLRGHWKWNGGEHYITSDCGATQDVWKHHNYTDTNAQGAAVCFEAGMDSSCEYTTTKDIHDAWDQGLLSEDRMDVSLHRLYEGLIRTGFFDGNSSEWASLGWKDVNTPEAQALALKAAIDGIVLLKNDGTLPLSIKDHESVAMIGFWADDETKLQGGYSGVAPFLHTPVYAAEHLGLKVNYANGPTLQNNSVPDNWTADALAAADASDYILYFGGLDLEAAEEDKDRYVLDWPAAQLTLLDKLAETGKPIVVVQLGDQVDNTKLLESKGINAILWASYPGQDGGPAVLELITGRSSPAGRLPVTQYPSNYTDAIPITEMALRPNSESPGRTYSWYSTPVAPFGFGLHYTTFKAKFKSHAPKFNIQNLVAGCNEEFKDRCALPPLKVSVKNTGTRKSDFVSLVFIKGEVGPKPYPLKTLATYGRLRDIDPGETKTLELEWTLDQISRRDINGDLVIYPGTYTLLLDEPTQAELNVKLKGKKVVLDKWPALPQ